MQFVAMQHQYGNALSELTLAEKPVTGLYDWPDLTTAFNKANESFQYLCEVDEEFRHFQDLFNRDQVRASISMMTTEEQAALEERLGYLLILVCPHLSKPKVLFIIDWLMRKYFIHAQYVDQLMQAVLPHHMEKFAIKLIQHLDWRFVDSKKWGWLKPFAEKAVCISNEALAKACASVDNGVMLNRIMWNALEHLGQDEQRLLPFVQLYVTGMLNILKLPLGNTKWAQVLQPALEVIERGLKRKACSCFASGVRAIMLRSARTMPLNPDLVQHWTEKLLRAAKVKSSSKGDAWTASRTVETVFMVKSLCLAQSVSLNEKSQSMYNAMVSSLSGEHRDLLRAVEQPQTKVNISAPPVPQAPATSTQQMNSSADDATALSLLKDLTVISDKKYASVLDKVKQNRKKKGEVAKKVESEELHNIFLNEHVYSMEQIEAVLVRSLSSQSGLQWAMTPGLTGLLAKLLQRYKEIVEGGSIIPVTNVGDVEMKEELSKEDSSDDEAAEDKATLSQQATLRSIVSLMNQILLCLLSLCQSELSTISSKNEDKKSSKRVVLSPSLDVEPIFQCLTTVQEREVHRVVMQVVNELARLMPWTLVHHMVSVMRHMSYEVLPLDDENSLHLVSQLVSVAIPAYVSASLRSHEENSNNNDDNNSPATVSLSLMSDLIPVWSSIPAHRRVLFYRQLVHALSKSSHHLWTMSNTAPNLTDKSHFLWVLVLLFMCELLHGKSDAKRQSKLFTFLETLLKEYNYLHQIATITQLYRFLVFLCDHTKVEADTEHSAQMTAWNELKKLVLIRVQSVGTCPIVQEVEPHGKRRRTRGHSQSHDMGDEDVIPNVICVVATLHQRLISQQSRPYSGKPPHSSTTSMQLSVELKEMLVQLMHLWQWSQSRPDMATWRMVASTLHALLQKLATHLPLDTYLHVLMTIVSGTHSTPHGARLRNKAFELLLAALKACQGGSGSGDMMSSLPPSSDAEDRRQVLQACLLRLRDLWRTSGPQETQVRCHTLLCMKELANLLLSPVVPTDTHVERTEAVKILSEFAQQLCRFLANPPTSSVESTAMVSNTSEESDHRKRHSSQYETNSGGHLEEVSLSQLVVAGVLSQLHKSLLPHVASLLLSCHSVVTVGNVDEMEHWKQEYWQSLLAALQLMATISTAHHSLCTEMLEEWKGTRLVDTFTTLLRMAGRLQTLLRRGENKVKSGKPRLKDSCAAVAKLCLMQLQTLRDAISRSSNGTEFLLHLFQTKDYAVTRGALSMATLHCRHQVEEREANAKHSDTWDSDTHLLHMADLALDASHMTLTVEPVVDEPMEVSGNEDNDSEKEEEMLRKAMEDPLWDEIERFLVALLRLPDPEELEERVALLQRLVTSSESHEHALLRMKMLLGVVTKFIPYISPENAEELVGRVGFTSLLENLS